jgi:hypothetical protein
VHTFRGHAVPQGYCGAGTEEVEEDSGNIWRSWLAYQRLVRSLRWGLALCTTSESDTTRNNKNKLAFGSCYGVSRTFDHNRLSLSFVGKSVNKWYAGAAHSCCLHRNGQLSGNVFILSIVKSPHVSISIVSKMK